MISCLSVDEYQTEHKHSTLFTDHKYIITYMYILADDLYFTGEQFNYLFLEFGIL